MACFRLLQLMIIISLCLCPTVAFLPDSTLYFSTGNRTTWPNNNDSFPQTTKFKDGSQARFILFQQAASPVCAAGRFGFGFGFYCNWAFTGYCDLSILFVDLLNGQVFTKRLPQVVWTANWNKPVRENATLKFSQGGSLSLIDENSTEIWSTNTSGMSVVGMRIDERGNMMLLNKSNVPVWESSDRPTDTLLLGQVLMEKQQLTSRITSVNASQGLFYLSLNSPAIVAYVAGDKPIQYLNVAPAMGTSALSTKCEVPHLRFVQFIMGGMGFYYKIKGQMNRIRLSASSSAAAIQFLRLDTDGALRIYGWNPGHRWRMVHFWPNGSDECWIPLKCGSYGVCKNGQCTCPVGPDGTDYFTLRDDQDPNQGCRELIRPQAPFQGTSPEYEMIYFGNLSYFAIFDPKASTPQLNNEDSCKQACLRNTSCKATFFVYNKTTSERYCYLQSDLLSIMGNPHGEGYSVSAYMKMASFSYPEYRPFHSKSWKLILLAVYAFLITMIVIVATCFLLRQKMNCACKHEKDLNSVVSGTLTSFSYSELSFATANFAKRLGGGGFGAVYKGMLKDGTMVAVKRLEKTGQGVEEFLAEVDTIGNIHHINLVKLIGFCVEKRQRILVYEYMTRGSLDKWIFQENNNFCLDWKTRKKIVLDIAKGLAYLHGDCRQRIAHLDVKPQNILLDDNFNAKVSDFGLSKLINRDQSQVVTRIRGTLGYLAPEWQHSRITVKADIYSFGIVVLEVVTGRKVLDYNQPDSDVCLLNIVKKKCLENRLVDIIDLTSEELQQNLEEINAMIMLGLWCVNEDYTRRPCMNSVVKLLEEEKMRPNQTAMIDLRFPLAFPVTDS